MRLTAALVVAVGLQLVAAIKPPGFPHGGPFYPHHRPPPPPGPPYPRYPPPGSHSGFSPRPYHAAAVIRNYGSPDPPPPLPPHPSRRPAASTTTAAPSAVESGPETVAPALATAATSTTPHQQTSAEEAETETPVYFSTAGHVKGTTAGDGAVGEAVAEVPPTTESNSAKSESEDPKSSPAPRPTQRRVPHPTARPAYHPHPHPGHHHPVSPHHRPFVGGFHGPAPIFHARPGSYQPRGHSKPKTYYASGHRPSPPTTPASLVSYQPAPTPSRTPEAYASLLRTSAQPTYTRKAASTSPPSTTALLTPPTTPTHPPSATSRRESEPTTLSSSERPRGPARAVPSYPAQSVPSQSPRPIYQLSFGTYDDDRDSSIPGVADVDYPTLTEVPETSFTCDDKIPGYYADQEASCQVWHYCGRDVSRQSFLCPVGTVYSQTTRVCDWWFNVNCAAAESQYGVNADLYQPAAAAGSYGQRRSAGSVGPPLAPQPYSRGPHEYHALPQGDTV